MRVITAAGMAARCELAKISKKLHADCRNYLAALLHYLHLAENIFTARKQNLGQGNVFTGVCLSMRVSASGSERVCLWVRGGCAHPPGHTHTNTP